MTTLPTLPLEIVRKIQQYNRHEVAEIFHKCLPGWIEATYENLHMSDDDSDDDESCFHEHYPVPTSLNQHVYELGNVPYYEPMSWNYEPRAGSWNYEPMFWVIQNEEPSEPYMPLGDRNGVFKRVLPKDMFERIRRAQLEPPPPPKPNRWLEDSDEDSDDDESGSDSDCVEPPPPPKPNSWEMV
jgi:hypothetical protein